MIRDNNFFVIQGFMRSELKLKGNELLIYAIIYSETVKGRCYEKPLSELMSWTGCTKQEAVKALKSLRNKDFIGRVVAINNGVKKVGYWCI